MRDVEDKAKILKPSSCIYGTGEFWQTSFIMSTNFMCACSKFDQNCSNGLTVMTKKRFFKQKFEEMYFTWKAFFRKMT